MDNAGQNRDPSSMVHKIDAADLAALAFIKGADGVSPGMWLQLQNLMKGDMSRQEMDPAEISKLVKNILESGNKEVFSQTFQEGFKFPPSIRLLPSLSKPSQQDTQLLEKGGIQTKLPDAKPEKMEAGTKKPGSQQESQNGPLKESGSQQVERQRQLPKMGLDTLNASKSDSKEFKPMETAIKQVAHSLAQLNPQDGKKETKPPVENKEVVAHKSEGSNPTKPLEPTTKPDIEMKSGDKASKDLNKPEKLIADKVVEKQIFTAKTEVKETTKSSNVIANSPVLPNKKETELQLATTSRGVAQSNASAQTQSSEKAVIPGAPYQTQFLPSELRRKEKKKYPHYFSDREDGEEDTDPQDHNRK
jgi:hypothetical protein